MYNLPSGTFATIIPIRKIAAISHLCPKVKAIIKNKKPKNNAIIVTSFIKCSNSFAIGVFPGFKCDAK